MFKLAVYAALLLSLFVLSCHQKTKTEQEEVAFWKTEIVDSAYHLLYHTKDTARALRLYDSTLDQSSTSIYKKAARFGLLADFHYFFTDDNAATAKMIDSALAFFTTSDLQNQYPRTYVRFLLFGGQIAYRLAQYSKANDYYFKAKKIADAFLNPCEKTAFNYSIAMVLYRQRNFSQSLNYFRQAFDLQASCASQTTPVVLQQQEIQSNIGLCLTKLKVYDSALIHFNTALLLADSYKDSLGPATMDKIYGVIYGNKAAVLLAQNQLAQAEQLSLKSIALNDKAGYEVENAMGVKLQLAAIYYRQKNLTGMFSVLSSMEQAVEGAPPEMRLEWKRLMASYYERVSQPENTLLFFKSYISLRDSIEEVQESLTAADITRQLKEKEQELEITSLRKDKHLAFISLWVTIVLSCMALAIIFLVYYNYRRSKKSLSISLSLNEEIRLQKAAREEEVCRRHKMITEAVIQAQETERSLIGLELHDNINQILTTVKLHNEMVLEGIGDPKKVLPLTLQYLQNCIDEIRNLSRRLSAPTLGKISLEESIQDLIDSINRTSKVKISREITGLSNETLKQEVHVGVYRILQEQLNNVLKHAEASEVMIHLEKKEDRIRLTIADNGKGFVIEGNKNGIGMMNMQTRAENLNGTFSLSSKPGRGCKVEVVLPWQ